ncbi:MAG: DUF805 domain-containing protein [Monoglobales bacterium]
MKFCGKCGAKLVEGNEFCTQCGTRISDYNVDNAAEHTESGENYDGQAHNQNDGYCQNQYSQQGQSFYNQSAVEPEKSLFDYFLKCLKHYADFNGRARRKEYWGFALFLALFYFAAFIVAVIIDLLLEIPIFTILLNISILAFIIPGIAVTIRRLHDIGKSGAWYFVSFVPFIGGIWIFVLTLLEGEPRTNIYGPPTKRFTYYG